jgi:hypothetical protein
MKKDTCINPKAGRLTRAENDNRTREHGLLILLGMVIFGTRKRFPTVYFPLPLCSAMAGIHTAFIKTARVFCIVG